MKKKSLKIWRKFYSGTVSLGMLNWIHYRDLILRKSGVWKNCLNSKYVYHFQIHMRIRFYYKKNIINETFSSYCSVPSGQCKNMSMGHEIAGIKKSNFYALKGECIIHYQILICQKDRKNIILFEKVKLVILIMIFQFSKLNCPRDMLW